MTAAPRGTVLKARDINTIGYDNYREIDEKKITDYYTSIKEVGVVVPVKIKKTEKGLMLVDGHHRVECARRIMKDYPHILLTIQAVWDETPADAKTEAVDKVVSNITRRESVLDRAQGYQLLIDAGKSIQQVADTVGKDRTTIENHLGFLVVYHAHKEIIHPHLGVLKDSFLYKIGQKFRRDPSVDIAAAVQKEQEPKVRKGGASVSVQSDTEVKLDPESVLAEAGYSKTDAKKICKVLRVAGFHL